MSFSNYLENALLDHLFGKTAFNVSIDSGTVFPLKNIYVGLSDTDPGEVSGGANEPTGGNYSRISTTPSDWDAAVAGTVDNTGVLSFPQSTAAWLGGASLTHFVLFDAAAGGNMLGSGSLTTPRTVDASGITLSFAAGDLDVSLD